MLTEVSIEEPKDTSPVSGEQFSVSPEMKPVTMANSNEAPRTTGSNTSLTINITSNIDSPSLPAPVGPTTTTSASGSRPATLPISSPFGPPTDANLATMVKSSTTGDLNATGLVATLATPKGTPLDAMKEWTDTFYKCTLQYVNEKLGKCPRTVDQALEGEIDRLRETQQKYRHILETTRSMGKMYATLVRQQLWMGKSFSELAARESKRSSSEAANSTANGTSPQMSLAIDFRQNADMFRNMARSGEKLVLALRFFCCNLDTVANKTIEDTILTIRAYESARLEFDAEKNAVAQLLPAQAASATNTEKLIQSRARFERLKEDVSVKMQFLDENKAKVMHKQLILLHNAFAAYASGNEASLESTMKQFSIRANPPQSWLEK